MYLDNRMVREFSSSNDVKQTRKLVQILTEEFAVSQNPHSRKGGLIGLAATAIALGKVCMTNILAVVGSIWGSMCHKGITTWKKSLERFLPQSLCSTNYLLVASWVH